MADLELRQLRYFVETARTKSMSRAAKSLFVSQQALSKGVKALEAALGGELFNRTRSGVELTAFGAFFLERARLVLATAQLAQNSYRDFETGAHRVVRLGMPAECMTDFGGTLSPAKLYAFQKAHPHVTFEFDEMPVGDIRARLEDGSLQFGIGIEASKKRYDGVVLARFPLAVLVSRDNPLANAGCITPQDLARGSVAVPADQDSFSRLLRRLEAQAGQPIRQLPIKLNPVDGSELIVDRDIFAIRPEQHARRTTSTERVALVPLVDAQGTAIDVPLDLVWHRARSLDEEERALVDYLVALYANREDSEEARN